MPRYGPSLAVFAVQVCHDTVLKKSLRPSTDYAAVEGPDMARKTTIAHEVLHACSLLHHESTGNFMRDYPRAGTLGPQFAARDLFPGLRDCTDTTLAAKGSPWPG